MNQEAPRRSRWYRSLGTAGIVMLAVAAVAIGSGATLMVRGLFSAFGAVLLGFGLGLIPSTVTNAFEARRLLFPKVPTATMPTSLLSGSRLLATMPLGGVGYIPPWWLIITDDSRLFLDDRNSFATEPWGTAQMRVERMPQGFSVHAPWREEGYQKIHEPDEALLRHLVPVVSIEEADDPDHRNPKSR